MSMTSPASTSPPRERKVLSVSQLNGLAKQLLEDQLPLLWVEGEISNLAQPSSGHWYFTLKDDRAQIRCAMFRGRNRDVQFAPKQGDKVLVRGRVSLYEGRGDFQLIAEHMEPSGFGALHRQFEQLKAKLEQEGLFDPARKKPLPTHPLHIGVLTSPTGAAVRDVLSVLKRRMPSVPVTVVPMPVQGAQAAGAIINALQLAENSGLFDVLIITRGGGSMEDLWCFNDESLARAIAACPLPIVSAVGHEIDFTIADFVADHRAPTPSAAAEILSHNQVDLLKTLLRLEQQLAQALKTQLATKNHRVALLKANLKHPKHKLENQSQQLDNLEMRLHAAFKHHQQTTQSALAGLSTRLSFVHPKKTIQQQWVYLINLRERLNRAAHHQHRSATNRTENAAKRLNTVSPLNTLNRGYAIALDKQGSALVRASSAEPGQEITVRLAEGSLDCTVNEVNED